MRRIYKAYFEDLYNMAIYEQVAVYMCGFDGVQRGNYFRGEPMRRTRVEMKVGKLRNRKAAAKDEITVEMIKGGGDMGVDWI